MIRRDKTKYQQSSTYPFSETSKAKFCHVETKGRQLFHLHEVLKIHKSNKLLS